MLFSFLLLESLLFVSSYNIVSVHKKPIVFFPAKLKQDLPEEMYGGFINRLNEKYNVYVSENNDEKNIEKIDEIKRKTNDLLFLSHSSGANNLMNMYNKYNTTKCVMVDPLDFNKYNFDIKNSMKFDFGMDFDINRMNDNVKEALEKDYFEVVKNFIFNNIENEIEEEEKNNFLILNNKKSSEWRFVPLIPPIGNLKMSFDDLNVKELEMDEYNHFDLLDKPWSNMINKMTMSTKKDNSLYYEKVITEINNFYD